MEAKVSRVLGFVGSIVMGGAIITALVQISLDNLWVALVAGTGSFLLGLSQLAKK